MLIFVLNYRLGVAQTWARENGYWGNEERVELCFLSRQTFAKLTVEDPCNVGYTPGEQ